MSHCLEARYIDLDLVDDLSCCTTVLSWLLFLLQELVVLGSLFVVTTSLCFAILCVTSVCLSSVTVLPDCENGDGSYIHFGSPAVLVLHALAWFGANIFVFHIDIGIDQIQVVVYHIPELMSFQVFPVHQSVPCIIYLNTQDNTCTWLLLITMSGQQQCTHCSSYYMVVSKGVTNTLVCGLNG
jgi:hypothetical protein